MTAHILITCVHIHVYAPTGCPVATARRPQPDPQNQVGPPNSRQAEGVTGPEPRRQTTRMSHYPTRIRIRDTPE